MSAKDIASNICFTQYKDPSGDTVFQAKLECNAELRVSAIEMKSRVNDIDRIAREILTERIMRLIYEDQSAELMEAIMAFTLECNSMMNYEKFNVARSRLLEIARRQQPIKL